MWWFKSNQELAPKDLRLASADEIRETFASLNDELLWLAETITGDAAAAEKCVINATELSQSHSRLFRDWLAQWARSATIRSSLDHMREQIASTAARKYQQLHCSHGSHEVLSSGEVAALEQWPATALAAHLDPLSRAVLLLRGVEHAAVQDCALTLNLSRAVILAAYCSALGWLASGTLPLCADLRRRAGPGLVQSLQKV